MVDQLATVPASRDVTTGSRDTWAVAFANALQAGESIASAAAVLYTAMPGDDGEAVTSRGSAAS
jgi:hypothetical protein